jgi:ankyrin repeat protein
VDHGADVSVQSVVNEPKKRYGVNYKGTEAKTGGLTALILAAREGGLPSVDALVAAKANVNQPSGDGSTAMLVAIQNGHYDVATYLLNHAADPNLANEKGWNPLYLAVKHRNIETGTIPVPNSDQAMDFIKLLLDKGANPNLRLKANTEIRNGQRATWLNEAGATPFLRAALCGDIEAMKLLLAHGADPSLPTDDHTTPLMAAAGVGYTDGFIHDRSEEETIDAMKLIVEKGANVNDVNDAGLTALMGRRTKLRWPRSVSWWIMAPISPRRTRADRKAANGSARKAMACCHWIGPKASPSACSRLSITPKLSRSSPS